MFDLAKSLMKTKSRLGGVAAMTVATALNQALSMLILPVLVRLYSPEDFGFAAYIGSILGILLVCSGFRYELAVPLCKNNNAALNVLLVSVFFLCCLLFLVFFSTFFILYFRVGSLPGVGGDPFFVSTLLAIGVFLGGGCQIASYWAVRRRDYSVIAKTRFQQGVATSFFQLFFGFFSISTSGLILGQVFGQGVGLYRLVKNVLRARSRMLAPISLLRLTWALKRYRRFPLVDIWAALLNSISALAPVLLFSSFFSVSLAGYYALSTRILSIPMSLLGASISQVFLGKISEHKRLGTLNDLVLNTQYGLSVIVFVPMAVFAGLSRFIVEFAFGPQWVGVGPVAAWSSLWVAIQFVYVPLSMTLIGLEAQGKNLVFQLMLFFARFASIFVGCVLGFGDLVVAAYSVCSAFVYVFGLFFIYSEAGVERMKGVGALVREMMLAFFVFSILSSISDVFWLSIFFASVLLGYTFRVLRLKRKFLAAE